MKKLVIKTYGCQMNVYDSQRMADLLAPLGYGMSDDVENADMVILNTCHIREKASEKVYSELGRLRDIKTQRKEQGLSTMIAVAGCVAQAEGAEIMARQPAVDMVVGPQSFHRLPEMIARVTRGVGKNLETDFPAEEKFDALPQNRDVEGVSAFLTVQEGCDKFCTFCVVPYTRGAEFSRNAESILDEARMLAGKGVCDVTLLGQNVNAYRASGVSLAGLIADLAKIKGLSRIRYMTSHPRDMDEDLIALHGAEEKLMPFLHLPVQSGSDKVLQAMNRQHGASFYMDLVGRIRDARPDIALSSDFIVGFPGETDEDFNDTMKLVRAVRYAQAFSFKYSSRPGTPAASAAKHVPEDVKDARLQVLQREVLSQQDAFNDSVIGHKMDVLFEKKGREAGQGVGKSPYLQAVHAEGAQDFLGLTRRVRIVARTSNSLKAELIGAPLEVAN